jgi:hypothetical protein
LRTRPAVGSVSRVLVVAAVVVGGLGSMVGGVPAGADNGAPGDDSVAVLRSQADALATKYFAALTRARALDNEIASNERAVQELDARAQQVRQLARARAVSAYERSGTELTSLLDARGTLDVARRTQLLDRVNARDNASYAHLRVATQELRAQRQVLQSARDAQVSALDQLKADGAAMDAKLAAAEQQEQALAAAATAARTAPAPSTPTPAPATASTAAPTSSSTPTSPSPTPTAPSYTGTPGQSPHHDDPFLTCVRARESGGNYGAVNPAGPYLGAYQFLQTTWNGAANHAGRNDLVGVPANVATPYDQDEVAWALYQWQGMGPWGGSCP